MPPSPWESADSPPADSADLHVSDLGPGLVELPANTELESNPLGTHALEPVPTDLGDAVQPGLGETTPAGGAPSAQELRPSAPLKEGARAFLRFVRVPGIVLALYTVLFNLSVVRGNSMAPGIHDGDRILVEPWSYFFSGVGRGDVVVLRYPLDPTVDYIKRVVGLPGDRVRIQRGRVWINDEVLPEPYVAFADPHSYLDTVVQSGHYFVLGDNRPRSSDSRDFGQVPAPYLRGRVDLRLWPLDRIGLVD